MAGRNKRHFKLNLLGFIRIETEIDDQSRFTKNVIIALLIGTGLLVLSIFLLIHQFITNSHTSSWGAAGLASIGGLATLLAAILKNKV